MEIIWKFKFYPRGNVSYAPIVSDDRVFVLSDYHVWSLDIRWGFLYFKEPIVIFWERLLLPKRGWAKNFLFQKGLFYILLKDRFGKTHKVVFNLKKRSVIRENTGPLYRKVKYIFKSKVKIERCYIDGNYREGITAFSHPDGNLLWTSSSLLRPAIKYTELVGDIIQVGDGIIMAQNYFSRKGKMPAGYSIICFEHKTGSVIWRIESYTYYQVIYPFFVEGDFMYVTTSGHKEGFFKKIDLRTGKIMINDPFLDISSGVCVKDGVFYFGAGDEVLACIEDG